MPSKTTTSELASICRSSLAATPLNFQEKTVLTEAATGVFAATACLAAMGRGRVLALAKNSRFGTREEAFRQTRALAKALGVEDRISFLSSASEIPVKEIDLLTNSGNLRPIRSTFLRSLGKDAVVSLMVEPWEVRPKDISLSTLRRRKIPTAGPNESHEKLGVFRYLGELVEKVLRDRGVDPEDETFFLHCDPRFETSLSKYLRKSKFTCTKKKAQASVVILGTGPRKMIGRNFFGGFQDGTRMVQLWAEVPYRNRYRRFEWVPATCPPKGHMGLLLSDLGPEPAIRLSHLGLKVGELLLNAKRRGLEFSEVQRLVDRSKIALPPNGW